MDPSQVMENFKIDVQRLLKEVSSSPRNENRVFSSEKRKLENEEEEEETIPNKNRLQQQEGDFSTFESEIKLIRGTDQLPKGVLSNKLQKLVLLHATLIRDMRSDVLEEIELLFKMLTIDDSSILKFSNLSINSSTSSTLTQSECIPYAVAVLTQIESQLLALGPQICEILSKKECIKRLAPNLAESLRRRAESTSSSSTNKSSSFHYQVPYREETDSKHHFISPEQKLIWENREKIRDLFLICLNRVISSQNKINNSDLLNNDPTLILQIRNCVMMINPDNYAWFARLFVQYLRYVSGQNEFDNEIKTWANQKRNGGEEKINKLSRRMEAGTTTTTTTIGFDDRKSFSSPQQPINHFRSRIPLQQQPQQPTQQQQQRPQYFDFWDELFPHPAERFFPLFIFIADSYCLSSNIIQCCISTLHSLSFTSLSSSNDLNERLSACNIIAKFLGFVSYYPRFLTTRSTFEFKNSSIAFESLYKELLDETNRTGPLFGMDLRKVLLNAVETSTITLVIPWLYRFLISGPIKDEPTKESLHLEEVLTMLVFIRNSAFVKLAIKKHVAYGFFRMISDIDLILFHFKFSQEDEEEDSMKKNNSRFLQLVRLIQVKYPKFVDILETERDFSKFGPFDQFDSVRLDRPATTCLSIEKLRQVLLSLTVAQSSSAASFRPKPRRAALTTTTTTIDSTTNVSNVPSLSLDGQQQQHDEEEIDKSKEAVYSSILHHQEDVSRLVEYSLFCAPTKIMNDIMPEVIQKIEDQLKEMNENDDNIFEKYRIIENIVLECTMTRTYYLTYNFIKQLVELSFSRNNEKFQKVVMDIACEKCQVAIQKVLKIKIASHLQQLKLQRQKKNRGT